MSASKFYVVSEIQTIFIVLNSALISAALVVAANAGKQFLELPRVILEKDKKCVQVVSYKNGEAFTCGDVDLTLRNYRIEQK